MKTNKVKKNNLFALFILIPLLLVTFSSKSYGEQITLGTKIIITDEIDEDVVFSAWSPDGKKIAFVKREKVENGISPNWNIWIMDVSKNDIPFPITQSTDQVDCLTPLAWFPDGTKVIFHRISPETSRYEIAAADTIDPLDVTTLKSDLNKDYVVPDISKNPNNLQMVFCDGSLHLYSVHLDENYNIIEPPKELTAFEVLHPRWSYSAEKISFIHIVDSKDFDVYVLKNLQDISEPLSSLENDYFITKIRDNDNFSGSTDFSFDERLIYFTEDLSGNVSASSPQHDEMVYVWLNQCEFRLFYMNADGTGIPKTFSDESDESINQAYMVASPDGTWVSFISVEDGEESDLYISSLIFSDEVTTAGGLLIDGSGTYVDIPANALSESTTIFIETPPYNNIPPSTIPMVTARDFGPDGLIFNQPVNISIHYTDASVMGLNENDLQIYYYNDQIQTWESLGGIVDPDANTITTQVMHFSTFAVMEAKELTLEELIQDVKMSDIDKGIKNSLTKKLTNAKKQIEKGNFGAAINMLKAFQNQINALTGKKIPESLAEKWINAANEIINSLL